MRICVIGSQCVGKTTLVNLLSQNLSLPLITEVARDFNKDDLNPCSSNCVDVQKQILKCQLDMENKYSSFISDRSSIDGLAYWLYGCANQVDYTENSKYFKKAMNNAKKYTHIFYLRPEFEIVDDGFRSCDPQYQQDIDYYINLILDIFHIKHYQLTGNTKNRLRKAMDIING